MIVRINKRSTEHIIREHHKFLEFEFWEADMDKDGNAVYFYDRDGVLIGYLTLTDEVRKVITEYREE